MYIGSVTRLDHSGARAQPEVVKAGRVFTRSAHSHDRWHSGQQWIQQSERCTGPGSRDTIAVSKLKLISRAVLSWPALNIRADYLSLAAGQLRTMGNPIGVGEVIVAVGEVIVGHDSRPYEG